MKEKDIIEVNLNYFIFPPHFKSVSTEPEKKLIHKEECPEGEILIWSVKR